MAPQIVPEPPPPTSHPLAGLAVLIPVWQPAPVLLALVRDLLHRGFGLVLVVDDGSDAASAPLFRQLASFPRVELLRQSRNRGKGRALKTGLAYLLHTHPELAGAVTADADGQHLPADTARVGLALLQQPRTSVLGVRDFTAGAPWRSRLGNQLTSSLFGLLTGTALADTQTGLRALPRSLFAELLALPGERYEYETAVLAFLCRISRAPRQVAIATVYLDRNRSSHFHPIVDSLRVYRELLRSAWSRLSPPPDDSASTEQSQPTALTQRSLQ